MFSYMARGDCPQAMEGGPSVRMRTARVIVVVVCVCVYVCVCDHS